MYAFHCAVFPPPCFAVLVVVFTLTLTIPLSAWREGFTAVDWAPHKPKMPFGAFSLVISHAIALACPPRFP
jgi:hypothetical protein